MTIAIQAKEKPLAKIFNDDYAFSIPSYQRPYAWTADQASELFTDLLSFLGDGSKVPEEVNPYFLGSIVLIKREESPDADIVDGQQRLITVTILLSVMREAVPPEYEITKFIYEKGDLILGTPNRYRLRVRERDEDFFRRYVQDENGLRELRELNSAQLNDSQRNMQANAKYFTNELERLSDSQRISLLKYTMKRCFLVVVSTPDLDSAYRIFSVLNSRGLDLELSDLLKSEIIGAIPKEQQVKYTDIWEGEEEELGRETFQELFAHIRMIYRKAKLRETALSEFRKYIQPHKQPQIFIDQVLEPYSDSLQIIKNASYESDRDAGAVNSLLRWLNLIDNVDWIPPAIVFLSQNRNNPERVKRFLADLERLAAGLMVMRANINERVDRYARVLSMLEENGDLYAAESPLQLSSSEGAETLDTLNGDLYLMTRIRQYVLLRLDSSLAQGEATYDYPVISVEHVLPQTPKQGSVWLQWWPIDEERIRQVHRLGNLALLSRRKNSEARNYEFDEKKKKYFATAKGVSPFALTTQVLQQSAWTPEVVNQRQQELLHKLKELWRL